MNLLANMSYISINVTNELVSISKTSVTLKEMVSMLSIAALKCTIKVFTILS